MGKKLLLASLVLVLVVGSLVGCTQTPGGGDADLKKVTMVTDQGGVDDKSFNQAAWTGLDAFGNANSSKVTVNYLESNSAEDYAPNLTAAVDQGAGLVWAVGYMMADQLTDAAKNNTDTQFGIIDWAPASEADALSNVAYVVFKENEGSFLVGLIAGLTTKTNNVGFVGGMSGGVIEKFEVGFHAGVKAANPDATVQIQYAEDWGDIAKGEQIATTMINNGGDVVYHAAGGTGIGVAQACHNAQVHFIGVDVDQSELTPYTLTSMLKRLDTAIQTISQDWLDGQFEGQKIHVLGLADEGVGYVYDPEKISDEVKAVVDDFSAKIKSGELVVPSSNAEMPAFLDSLKAE
ncbi:MAG TPA: BMP family ABC transporter substrate-binding protein [Firmicutes bacterium]|nr:BMP family ABC transporter substrate-binding protein [Bacillota bacterium]